MDASVVKKSSSSHEEISRFQAAIMLLLMAVSLGSLLVWIMMPTNTYRQSWLPNIRASTNSTYFGTQGAALLIYTFPILFVAAVGCVYLHVGKKSNNNKIERNGRNHRFASWKRPVLAKGPLGIVSSVELGLFIMFIALLVWSFATYIRVRFAKITPQVAAHDGEKVWQYKLGSAALVLGLVGNICLAFVFYPVTRGSSVLPLFGLTSEGSIKYHIWLGHIVITLFTAHGICYIVSWVVTNRVSEMVKWDKTGISNVAGELSLLAGLAMWLTTFPRIRRKFFELFLYTHNLYILFIIFFILHVGISYACIMLPGFYLFAVDRYLRLLQSRQRVRVVSARLLPCQSLELNLAKSPGLSYNPLSIMFINVPSISKLQWHPFTITSNSSLEPEKISIVVKGEGSWSKKLNQMLSSPSSPNRLEVSVEGPYGPVSTDFLSFDTLVMVSGGSGITPFISIIRELVFLSTTPNCSTPKVKLICAFKNSPDLTMLDLILPISGTPSEISNLQLQIEAFVTRDKEPKTEESKPVRAIWFKPHAADAPFSAILGPNSWLWLGMIITSSFVIFLILIGIITRYYIYPIDHNTNNIFPTSARAVINMLVICICIAMTASAAVFSNKRRNAAEAKQVQNMEEATGSPGSHDMELESLPHQSLAQAINVHYGRRPDLKKMLLAECKGSSIKVVASGPKSLRQEVATICSSGSADNVHFESISFSW
ncbi:ferric reduction oxidase 2-like [Corylus avellana]|uniref:ferric reduction oxidase 2-like n=1 Tax=Corylus avellana TaxID=13451 RepID=UPI00286B9E55|nr:ferric reduction oxidase 2-like [Corylus avellana]